MGLYASGLIYQILRYILYHPVELVIIYIYIFIYLSNVAPPATPSPLPMTVSPFSTDAPEETTVTPPIRETQVTTESTVITTTTIPLTLVDVHTTGIPLVNKVTATTESSSKKISTTTVPVNADKAEDKTATNVDNSKQQPPTGGESVEPYVPSK